MTVLAGVLAALATVLVGKATRQADTIPFYSSVLVVIALAYVLFAVMAGPVSTIIAESALAAVFVGIAICGARWEHPGSAGVLIAVGLVVHGAYDLVHDFLITNAAVPSWWPVFCGVVDLALGGWVGARAVTNPLKVRLPTA